MDTIIIRENSVTVSLQLPVYTCIYLFVFWGTFWKNFKLRLVQYVSCGNNLSQMDSPVNMQQSQG